MLTHTEWQADTSSNRPARQLILCVWPIWHVHPKKLTGECGWNYMKERYPVATQLISYCFNHIPLLIFQDACVKSVQTHRICCGWLLDVCACYEMKRRHILAMCQRGYIGNVPACREVSEWVIDDLEMLLFFKSSVNFIWQYRPHRLHARRSVASSIISKFTIICLTFSYCAKSRPYFLLIFSSLILTP